MSRGPEQIAYENEAKKAARLAARKKRQRAAAKLKNRAGRKSNRQTARDAGIGPNPKHGGLGSAERAEWMRGLRGQ